MSMIEDLAIPGSVNVPPCRCGEELRLARIEASEVTAERRVFRCESCGHQLALTVWKAATA
jgi:predicted SprT family Zn-dependent metalloprotease